MGLTPDGRLKMRANDSPPPRECRWCVRAARDQQRGVPVVSARLPSLLHSCAARDREGLCAFRSPPAVHGLRVADLWTQHEQGPRCRRAVSGPEPELVVPRRIRNVTVPSRVSSASVYFSWCRCVPLLRCRYSYYTSSIYTCHFALYRYSLFYSKTYSSSSNKCTSESQTLLSLTRYIVSRYTIVMAPTIDIIRLITVYIFILNLFRDSNLNINIYTSGRT